MTSSSSNYTASTPKVRNVGLYYIVLVAVVLSTAVLVFGFEHELKETTEQTVETFRADNASALAAGNLPTITSRLNALMSSVNWVCISAAAGERPFFEQARGACGNSFFRRRIRLADGTQSDVRVVLTLRMPRTLERSFVIELCFHLLCLGVIFWGTKQAETERHIEETRRAELLAELASQVAHDIRSPLAALDSAMDDASQLPERKRIIIRSALNRIRDIANNLRQRHSARISHHLPPSGRTLHLLSSSIDSLVSEKREEFRSRRGIELYFPVDETSYGLFAMVQPNELKTALSNLINNAAEALDDKGRVQVRMSAHEKTAFIEVHDDGKGIPSGILTRLGHRGQTHGKAGGSGLGLYHARHVVEAWGGSLDIQSELGKGTIVRLSLPLSDPPDWWVSRLTIREGTTIVVLDDEPSIHELWRGRFDVLKVASHGVDVVYLFSADAARDWTGRNAGKVHTTLFLSDFELIGQNTDGLSLIAELGVSDKAVLVTSRFEEEPILSRCRSLGVQIIPKSLAGFVPISIQKQGGQKVTPKSPGAILIDDDPLVHTTWALSAKKAGRSLHTYTSSAKFLAATDGLDRSTPVYIDANLGDGEDGIDASRKIHALGFSEIWLETGHPASSFPAGLTHLRGIVGKEPPWSEA